MGPLPVDLEPQGKKSTVRSGGMTKTPSRCLQKVVFEVYTLDYFGYVTLCYSHIQILAFFTRLYTHVFISTRRINVNQAVPTGQC